MHSQGKHSFCFSLIAHQSSTVQKANGGDSDNANDSVKRRMAVTVQMTVQKTNAGDSDSANDSAKSEWQ